MKKGDYTYAVGKIRVLESRLLPKAKLEHILEAKDGFAALQELNTTTYAKEVGAIDGEQGFEDFREKEFLAAYRLIVGLLGENPLGKALLYRFDAYNLATLFKANYAGVESSSYLVDLGNFPLDRLVGMVKAKDFRDLPPFIRKTIAEAISQYQPRKSLQVFDFIFDRLRFQFLAEALEEESEFLKGFFKKMVDLVNLRTLLRLRRITEGKELGELALLPGGGVGREIFVRYFDLTDEQLSEEISSFDYAGIMAGNLDKNMDNYLTEYLKPAKSVVFTAEPLIGWLWAKEVELKNLGLLIRGKFNRIPAERIRTELRETYV